jgi:hypothetical protein
MKDDEPDSSGRSSAEAPIEGRVVDDAARRADDGRSARDERTTRDAPGKDL